MKRRNLLVLSGVLIAGIMGCGTDSTIPVEPGATGGAAPTGGASGAVSTGGSSGVAVAGGAGGAGITGGASGVPAGGAAGVCVRGTSQGCTCTNGAQGAQICNPSGTGFEPCMCTGGSGGTSGAGGVAGAGGSGTGGNGGCGDTSSDPRNCGVCGHACRGQCAAGACQPSFAACFNRTQFDTCDAFCSSIGESCTPTCSDGRTVWQGWDPLGQSSCEIHQNSDQSSTGSCSDPLPPLSGAVGFFNCCCTDTQ
jgi:hypothetical protein